MHLFHGDFCNGTTTPFSENLNGFIFIQANNFLKMNLAQRKNLWPDPWPLK